MIALLSVSVKDQISKHENMIFQRHKQAFLFPLEGISFLYQSMFLIQNQWVPSGNLYDKTAPIPWADTSQAKTIGYFGSKCTKTCDDKNNFLEALKA